MELLDHTEHWVTLAVTALPAGWITIWRDIDGSTYTRPCPALLLEEYLGYTDTWRDDGATARRRRSEHPDERQTRVVPCYFDHVGNGGELRSADSCDDDKYVGCTTEADYAANPELFTLDEERTGP